MLHPDLEDMIDDAFANHKVSEAPSIAWLVKNPERHSYWFKISWTPGVLTLSGDLGELVLTHYQAMPTSSEAIAWVNGGNEEYLLGKSTAEKKFSQEATKEALADMANTFLDDGDGGLWNQIFGQVDGCFDANGNFFRAYEASIHNEADREAAIEIISSELTPEFIYHNFQMDDYYGTYEYTEQHKWQIRAIQTWAAQMASDERQRTIQAVSG
jgi:hypothetical protein